MKDLLKKAMSPSNNLITYDVINNQHHVGEKVAFNEGLTTMRLDNNVEGTMFFRLCLKKGSIVHSHHHDCIKDVVLYEGNILEVVSNKELEKYKIMRLSKGTSHSFYAIEDSIVYIQLFKPQN